MLMRTPLQFVGIIAVNAAPIRPLFSKTRWLSSNRGQSSAYRKYDDHGSGHALATIGGSSRVGGDGPTMASRRRNKTLMDLEDNSSEEHIVKAEYGGHGNGSTLSSSSGGGGHLHDGIMVTTTYEVTPNKSKLNV